MLYHVILPNSLNEDLILVPMGVVVQEMVNADAAGVIFSQNPVTGNPSQIVITANYGLGEVGTEL